MTVREVLPCRECQTPTGDVDPVVGVFPFCGACSASSLDDFEKARAEFQKLLDQGIHRSMANRIMIQRKAR